MATQAVVGRRLFDPASFLWHATVLWAGLMVPMGGIEPPFLTPQASVLTIGRHRKIAKIWCPPGCILPEGAIVAWAGIEPATYSF